MIFSNNDFCLHFAQINDFVDSWIQNFELIDNFINLFKSLLFLLKSRCITAGISKQRRL